MTARTSSGTLEHGELGGVAEVDGGVFVGVGEAKDAVDEVGDVAEAAGLEAVAVDGEGLAAEGLEHEVGDDAAVVGLQARAVGVEDADDAGVDGVVAMPCGDGGLGEALGLVVDRARADGVDAAPVGFDLGMNLGIAVALGGGGVQEAGVIFAREVEGVDGSGGADE